LWKRPSDRANPLDILRASDAGRQAQLLPIRYGRMLQTPFTFYRGAAAVMAADLAKTSTTGIRIQACGDCHLLNFGGFATPERNILLDINDFDETLPAPWEWDVKRLAASIEVAARGNGFSRKQRQHIVTSSVRRYRETIRTFAAMSNLDVWYARVDLDLVEQMFQPRMTAGERRAIAKNLAKARTRDSMQAFGKLCGAIDGQTRIIADPPLIMPLSHLQPGERDQLGLEAHLDDLLTDYRRTLKGAHRILFQRYQLVDLARKVVGVGSVGTRCWVLLLSGNGPDDPLFLQYKEAQSSVLSPYLGQSKFGNHGRRFVPAFQLFM
jgi:uncharacterized protein (DUF2252 family)